MPWQLAAIDVAYEFDPDTGLFRYDEVDITVPRQSGKTTLTFSKKVHRLTVMARRLGPQRCTYTAQLRLAARRKLERDFAQALRTARPAFRETAHARARPTKATEWRLSMNNGNEHIQFGSGSYLQIDAPSRTGGHGDTLDDGTVDEAFAHETDEIEAAMRPAMSTRRNAQLWVISTAGDEKSPYLYRKVLAGRSSAESGSHGRVCSIEYSAPDDADPGDPATWWACMPALGNTVTEAFIRGEWDRAQRKGPEGIDTFCRAYLNRWPRVPVLDGGLAGAVIDLDLWDVLARRVGVPVAPVWSVEVSPDRSAAVVGAAWWVGSRRHVEVVQDFDEVDAVVPRMAVLAGKYDAWTVVVDKDAPANSLIPGLEGAGFTVVAVGSAERAVACAGIVDAATSGALSHDGDPGLLGALRAAKWKSAEHGTRTFSRKLSGDIKALYAVTLALHGLVSAPPVDVLKTIW